MGMRGEGDVAAGFRNKGQAAMAALTPQGVLAEQHRKMAKPMPQGDKSKYTGKEERKAAGLDGPNADTVGETVKTRP